MAPIALLKQAGTTELTKISQYNNNSFLSKDLRKRSCFDQNYKIFLIKIGVTRNGCKYKH